RIGGGERPPRGGGEPPPEPLQPDDRIGGFSCAILRSGDLAIERFGPFVGKERDHAGVERRSASVIPPYRARKPERRCEDEYQSEPASRYKLHEPLTDFRVRGGLRHWPAVHGCYTRLAGIRMKAFGSRGLGRRERVS